VQFVKFDIYFKQVLSTGRRYSVVLNRT